MNTPVVAAEDAEADDTTEIVSCGPPLGDNRIKIVNPDSREALEEVFRRTRTLRRSVIDARQAGTFRPTEDHTAMDPDDLG